MSRTNKRKRRDTLDALSISQLWALHKALRNEPGYGGELAEVAADSQCDLCAVRVYIPRHRRTGEPLYGQAWVQHEWACLA